MNAAVRYSGRRVAPPPSSRFRIRQKKDLVVASSSGHQTTDWLKGEPPSLASSCSASIILIPITLRVPRSTIWTMRGRRLRTSLLRLPRALQAR